MNKKSMLYVVIPVCLVAGLFVSVWQDNKEQPRIEFESIPNSKDSLVKKELTVIGEQLVEENLKLRQELATLTEKLDNLRLEAEIRQRYNEQFEREVKDEVEKVTHDKILNDYGTLMAAAILEGFGEALSTTKHHRTIKGEYWYELPSATYEKLN